MIPYRIAVCDDEQIYIQDIKDYLKAYESETQNKVIVTEYQNPEKLYQDFYDKKLDVDMMFLDVDMPEMSGVDLAVKVREIDKNMPICFITAHEEYAVAAYRVDAVSYITKPIKYREFKKLVDKSIIQLLYLKDAKAAEERYLSITCKRDKAIVDLYKVLYIEKRRNQCMFHLEDGEIICYESLMNIYKRLDHQQFYMVHQGYIVNFNAIKEVKQTVICLGENREIPVSRKYQPKMKELHMDKIMRIRNERTSSSLCH